MIAQNTHINCESLSKSLTIVSAAKQKTKFKADWNFEQMGIGGLDTEFETIFRRAFASRLHSPEILAKFGIQHVRGMLLYGPPGTGKTLIARQIGKMLDGREPKVVNGPEILNKYVGASEENIRNLFKDAEEDYQENEENADLHIIIFDEIDAICKARGSVRSGTGVHDTVVNQILSKMDGVDSLNNILVIGMTNRKELIDPALLRPGRLEVHVEISLADEPGRLQILQIHTKDMRMNKILGPDVDLTKIAELTKNFSGAELAGLVKSAASFALYGLVDASTGKVELKEGKETKVNMGHFLQALDEVIPSFGVSADELKARVRGDVIMYGSDTRQLVQTCQTLIRQVENSTSTPLLSVLLHGQAGNGKTAMAAYLALESQFPYVKLISPEAFLGMPELNKAQAIYQIFEDSYKSPLSCIIIDDLERIIDYVNVGPRFSNTVLQALLVLCKRQPPHVGNKQSKLIIIATTSSAQQLENMGLTGVFNVMLDVPMVTHAAQVVYICKAMGLKIVPEEMDLIGADCPFPIGIKQLLMVLEMAQQDVDAVTADRFQDCLRNCGLDKTSQMGSSTKFLS